MQARSYLELALTFSRIKAGEELTVGELVERYLEKHVAVRCKPKTEPMYRLIVAKYILPALSKRPALTIGHKNVTDIRARVRNNILTVVSNERRKLATPFRLVSYWTTLTLPIFPGNC